MSTDRLTAAERTWSSSPQAHVHRTLAPELVEGPGRAAVADPGQSALFARVVLRSLLPLAKVLLADDPKFQRRFAKVRATVQFRAEGAEQPVGLCLKFHDGAVEILEGLLDQPSLEFAFPSPGRLRAFFRGKPAFPRIKGLWRLPLLFRVFSLLLRLKLLHPKVRPTAEREKRLKIKLIFYMITSALSQSNKAGEAKLAAWTKKQPERIYQLSVRDEPVAAHLRVKAGNSQAGRGRYERRRPFVHLEFSSLDGALAVLLKDCEMVEAVSRGLLRVDGAPEYAGQLGDLMTELQGELS